jgi:hypothetical protein
MSSDQGKAKARETAKKPENVAKRKEYDKNYNPSPTVVANIKRNKKYMNLHRNIKPIKTPGKINSVEKIHNYGYGVLYHALIDKI